MLLKSIEMITENWSKSIAEFISLANEFQVEMVLVGGGAVNFHGYQRHSADVDFWINPSQENFIRVLNVIKTMGYEIDDLPEEVKQKQQNISLKFSPAALDVELITNFSINKKFEEALADSERVTFTNDDKVFKWNVLSLDDLIISKIKSGRPKDLLDIQELQKINNK